MRELTLFSLGKTKYGVWQDEVPTVKAVASIHWLPPVPIHIAGLSILDGRTVTLFDLAACIGLSCIAKDKQSYPVLFLKREKDTAGFMVDFVIGHFSIPSGAVHPIPEYLCTPLIDTCAMYDSEPIPVINVSRLFNNVQKSGFEPPAAESRISESKPQKASSNKAVRVFKSGGESFAVPESSVAESAVKPGRVSSLPLLPRYVSGISFHDENPITLIHLSRRMMLSEEMRPEQMLVADIGRQGFGLLVDSDRGQWDPANLSFKPLPPLVQSGWMQGAALSGKEIIPIIELGGLMSDQSDGSGEPPFPQRYTPDDRFKSLFGRQEVKVLEFSLLGVRHALPRTEVEDQFRVRPYRRLPNVLPIVAGVAEYKGELLPVLDPAACFGRASHVTDEWQMILVKNGDFRALVLTDTISGERSLPLTRHHAIPFDEPHSLVYGCYPDEARVRLILNVEALAVHFDKTLLKEFFAALSKQMPLDPMEIVPEPESEATKLSVPVEEHEKPEGSELTEVPIAPEEYRARAEALTATREEKDKEVQESTGIVAQDIKTPAENQEEITAEEKMAEKQEAHQILETELEVSKVGTSEEITPQTESEATPVKEQVEEIIELVNLVETEKPPEVEESPTLMPFQKGGDEKEIKKPTEIARPDIETAVAKPQEITAAEERVEIQAAEEIADTKAEGIQVLDSEEFGREPEPTVTEVNVSGEKTEEPMDFKESIPVASIRAATKGQKEIMNQKTACITLHDKEKETSEQEGIAAIKEISKKREVQESTQTELEVQQVGAPKEIRPQTEPEITEWMKQVEEDVELIEFIEAEELIEVEETSARTLFAAVGEIAPTAVEAVEDYPETETHEKPKRRFTSMVLLALLLIGFLTVVLDFFGGFEKWVFWKETGKLEAPIAAQKATLSKTSKPLGSEKLPAVLSGSKITEAQKEETEVLAVPAGYTLVPTKPLMPPAAANPPAVKPVPKFNEVEKEIAEAPAALVKPKPSFAKYLKPQTPKAAPVLPSGSEIAETEEVILGEPAAAEVHRLAPVKALKPPPPRNSLPELPDWTIHDVKKGDTLWDISKRYTGTGFNYPGVAKENKIQNPNLIFPKQKVRVRNKYESERD